jgi:hypothetical protein
MNVTYKALDYVDYEKLGCGTNPLCNLGVGLGASVGRTSSDNSRPKPKIPDSLVDIVAKHLTTPDYSDLLSEALATVPCHLANTLMRAACQHGHHDALNILASEWPLEVLELRAIYPEGRTELFVRNMEADTALFLGLMRREQVKDKAKLKCLDLRGFTLNDAFCRVLIGGLPLLSMKKEDRAVEKLTAELMQFLSVEGSGTSNERYDALEEDMLPIIQAKVEQFKSGYVYVPPGEIFTVKVDKLEFGRENSQYMEYLIMGALRTVTPCRLEAHNLYVETNVKENERLIDSCAPFLALLGQDSEVLQGLSLNNMEDMLFQYILRGVARFTKLRALDVGNCSISVTGKTRVRTALRSRIMYLFGTFTQLTRLDIRKSELTGNLGELLNALNTPLEYLNISGCNLNEEDFTYLAKCKHTKSLKELHVSSLVPRGDLESPECVLACVEAMQETLNVLAIQNNEIGDDHVGRLCNMMSGFKKLRLLDTLYNFMGQDSLLRLVEAATKCASLHCMAINLLPIFGSDMDVMERRLSFQHKCEEVLERCHRRDMSLVVVAIGIE